MWQGLRKSRVFVIRNVMNEAAQFQIEYRRPPNPERVPRIRVVPEFGRLEPLGAQVCQVTVESDTLPCSWDDFFYVVARQIRYRQVMVIDCVFTQHSLQKMADPVYALSLGQASPTTDLGSSRAKSRQASSSVRLTSSQPGDVSWCIMILQ